GKALCFTLGLLHLPGGPAGRKTFADARRTARLVGDAKNKAETLRQVAFAQAQAGDQKAARRTLAEALHTVRSMHDGWENHAAARRTFAEAVQAANSIPGSRDYEKRDRAEALDAIASAQAEAQAQAGDLASALTMASVIKGASDKANALCAIASAQTQAGDH